MPEITDTSPKTNKATTANPTVALYVTCLVNAVRPQIGFACVKLIEDLGFKVVVPPAQTCCGQPGYNGGQRDQAREVARSQIEILQQFDYVVIPSGSCAGMMTIHYQELLKEDPVWQARAESLAAKTHELSQFLEQHNWQPAKPLSVVNQPENRAGYWAHHTSCSCRRETRSHKYADRLLEQSGYRLLEFSDQEVCCGFGGSFSAKFDALSSKMGQDKLRNIADVGAEGVVSADVGCLLQLESLAGNSAIKFLHLAELLVAQPGFDKKTR